MEIQRTQDSQTIWIKKIKVGRLTCPNFKTFYQATAIKRVCYWHKDRHIYQWNRNESPEINAVTFMVNCFLTRISRQYSGRKNVLLNKWCWDNRILTYKWINLDPYLTPYIETNSKCIKDQNIKGKIIKCLEEYSGINHCYLGLGNGFLDLTPKVQATKEKNR